MPYRVRKSSSSAPKRVTLPFPSRESLTERRSWSLSPNARNKMVTKIMDTLQKHMPVRCPEAMDELKKIALRFEEKIYTAAADQQDYLLKICTKMISLETKNQVPGGNNLPIISAGSNRKH